MRSTLLLLIASLSLACQQNDTPVPLNELRETWIDTWCDMLVRCSMVTNRQACEEDWQDGDFFAQAHLSAQAGRAHYDADAAAACLGRLRSVACTDTELTKAVFSGACTELFTGKVSAGALCYNDTECVGHGSCEHEEVACNPQLACCAGTCEPPPAQAKVGESCVGSISCVDGLYCDLAAQICKVPQAAANAPCDSSWMCKAPMVCVALAGEEGQCMRRPATNEACDSNRDVDHQCEHVADHCDPITQRCVRRPSLGEACTLRECPGTACEMQEPCVGFAHCTQGVCQAAPNAAPDQACDDQNGPECRPGLDCIEGRCTHVVWPTCP